MTTAILGALVSAALSGLALSSKGRRAALRTAQLALQCIAASLEAEQARELAAAIMDGLVQILADRGEMSAEQDEAVAMQAGMLLRALSR